MLHRKGIIHTISEKETIICLKISSLKFIAKNIEVQKGRSFGETFHTSEITTNSQFLYLSKNTGKWYLYYNLFIRFEEKYVSDQDFLHLSNDRAKDWLLSNKKYNLSKIWFGVPKIINETGGKS